MKIPGSPFVEHSKVATFFVPKLCELLRKLFKVM